MGNRTAEILICLFIFAACIAVYGQTGDFSYVLYDDVIVLDDSRITGGLSLENIGSAFAQRPEHVPYQSPVPVLVRMAQWETVGNDFGRQHLFSVFLHAFTTMLLFLFFRWATNATWESGLCAMFFAVHPLNVEPVCWLAGMNGLLEGFFLAVTLIAYLHYTKKPSVRRYVMILLPFMLGLMCKPTIVLAPALLLLIDYWPLQRIRINNQGLRDVLFGVGKSVLEKIPLLVLAILYLSLGRMAGGGTTSYGNDPVGFHAGAVLDFIAHAGKIVYPVGLTICRPNPPPAALWKALLVLVGLVVVTCMVLWKGRSRKYIITGWLWFLTASLPFLLMVFLSGRPTEDRYFYIPLIGIFMAFSFGLRPITPGGGPLKRFGLILALLAVPLLALISHAQAKHWENSITIFTRAVSLFPDSERARANLGDAFWESGDIDAATYHYRKLVQGAPKSAAAHTKLANALARASMTDEAQHHYQEAIALSPDYVFAYHGFADFLMDQGETDRAIIYYRRALEIDPSRFQTHNNLAAALLKQGDVEEAVFHLREALRIKPDYETARDNLKAVTK